MLFHCLRRPRANSAAGAFFLVFFVFLCLAGIWPDGADGTDINAACRSHDGSLLASADDFGKVHLFSFPCSQPRVSHVNSQWQTQSTSEPGSACLYARVEICSTSQTRWLSALPELRSYGVCLSTALWLSFNEHWETQWKLSRNNRIPYHYQACNVHNECQVFILCSQTVAGC